MDISIDCLPADDALMQLEDSGEGRYIWTFYYSSHNDFEYPSSPCPVWQGDCILQYNWAWTWNNVKT